MSPTPNKKDPWSGRSEPPDLEAAIRTFIQKIKQGFGGKKVKFSRPNHPLPPSSTLSVGFAVFFGIVFILWILSGIYIIDPAEQGVVLRFGRYLKTVGPGPHWIPRFICTKIVKNVDRVLDYSYSAQMLTQDENLVAVSLVVQYRIGDLQAYLFNVSDPVESLQQATSSALRQVVGNTTLDQIITEGREAWGASVLDNLNNILKQYNTGIIIVNVSPQPARAPENVQDAFDDAIKAQEDEKRFKEQAYAYEASVVPIAEGNAKRILQEAEAFSKQVVLRATGDVAEFLALLPVYNRAPQITAERLYLDTLQKVFSNTTKIIVDTKANNLLYLPLDKLRAAASHLPPPPTDVNANEQTSISLNTPSLPLSNDAYSSVRPVERSTQRED